MFFMSGTLGDFIYVIPLVVVLALMVSFGELVIALPVHLIFRCDTETGKENFQTRVTGFRALQADF